jgi:uncharacterized protein YcfL
MRNFRYIVHSLLLVAVAVSFTACTSPPSGDPRVHIAHPLRNTLEVVAVDSIENRGGTLTFQITLRNRSLEPVKFRYKVDWFTESGAVYETILSNAKDRAIQGKEILTIREVAPNPEITSYRLQIRKD